ncbi:MAG TPA: cytochrome c4 [Oceanospirillales bacterium]|nr:cytochrome c4 [Oleispira sp.]HCM06729.1 cytochrome c4 [Oceanospirillales bacterium]|tara:strand:- start:10377 stop:10976 length:600 start_codon:yes stop_codon:yes gene_type:complete
MKKVLISLIVSVGLMSAAQAGDAVAGKTKAATCGACHGADGNSLAPNFPKIAGQGERYLVKQITEIKNGDRQVPEMLGFVMGLSETDIADIAAYYSEQKMSGGTADPALVEAGKRIFLGGNEATGVPACIACHGPAGKGMSAAGFPSVAGQHAAYTEKQLTDFYNAKRTNDASNVMRDIASRMHMDEIKAVSSYIQGLK